MTTDTKALRSLEMVAVVFDGFAHGAASLWLGLVLTGVLNASVPLHDPGAVWFGTSAAIWFLSYRKGRRS